MCAAQRRSGVHLILGTAGLLAFTCFAASAGPLEPVRALENELPPGLEVLQQDDACLEAGDGDTEQCALGAMQRFVHARMAAKGKEAAAEAAPAAPKPCSGDCLKEHAQDNLILLAAKWVARYEAGAEGVPPEPYRKPHADGWDAAEQRWRASGHLMPSWAEIPQIELHDGHGHERASLLAPIMGVSLLLACLFMLLGCRKVLSVVVPDEATAVLSEGSLPHISSRQRLTGTLEENHTRPLAGDSEGEALTVSRTPSTRTPSEADTSNTKNGEDGSQDGPPSASFLSLFRYATPKDAAMYFVAFILAIIHGCTVPTSFFMMDSLFKSIFLPNDDGTIPPTTGPHTMRDGEVKRIALTYVSLACVVIVCRSVSIMLVVWTADRQALQVRRAFFRQILRQGPSWHDLVNSSEMSTQLAMDTFYFREGIGEKLIDLVRALSVTCSAIFLGVYKDWKLTLLMILAMPVTVLAIGVSITMVREFAGVQQKLYSKAGSISESALQLFKTVASFNGQQHEMRRYGEQLGLAELKGTRMGLITGFCQGVNTAVMAFTLSLGMYAGSIWVLEGYERQCWTAGPPFGTCRTGGTMLASMYTITWGFSAGLGTVGLSVDAISFAKAAAQRIFAILDEPPVIQSGKQVLEQVKGAVEYDSVRFSYPGRQAATALYGVSLSIKAGTTAAFVGPSGSGKSTMVSLLLRFYEPQGGSIRVDGVNIRALDLRWLRSKIALVEQEPVLFACTVAENIAFGSVHDVEHADVERAAVLSNAHNFIMNFPKGYKTEVGERGAQLSGGQKQRIAIARALIRNPAILLLDEATSALDSESEHVVQEALDRLLEAKSRTTLVIAHRLTTIQNADKIFVMQDGHLVEEGTHKELMSQDGSLYGQLVKVAQGRSKAEASAALPETQPNDGPEVFETTAEVAVPAGAAEDSATKPGAQALLEAPKRASEPSPQAGAKALLDKAGAANVDKKPEEEPRIGAWLWRLSRPDFHLYFYGMAATFVAASIVPLYSIRFAQSINMFNRAPVVYDPESDLWIPDYDAPLIAKNVGSLCLTMQVVGVVGISAGVVMVWNFNAAGERLVRRLRSEVFRTAMRMEIEWHDENTPGTITGWLSHDIPHTRVLVGGGLATFFQALLQVVASLTLSLILSWRFTLTVFAALPIIAVGPIAMDLSLRRLNNNLSGSVVSEAISSIKTVSAFGLEERTLDRYTALLQTQIAGELVIRMAAGFGTGLAAGGIFLMLAITVWAANLYVNQALMPPDRATLVLFTLFSCTVGMSQVTSWLSESGMARNSARKIIDVLNRVPKIDSLGEKGKRPLSVQGLIEFESVEFHYPSRPDVRIFRSFSLTIKPNTTVALVGPSGSGKSTSVSMLQRFYDPQGGRVKLDGVDLRDLHIGWLRSQMGLVQQEPVLFAGTIMDNIKYSFETAGYNAVVDVAKMSNAHEFIMGMPDQYLTEVGSRGAQLSGGQKQRIAIARALLRQPAILLLDEATSALDAASERQVQEALDNLLQTKRRTTLIIAHRLSTIKTADQICVMHQGEVAELGTHEELMGKDGLYRRLVGRQQDMMAAERAMANIGKKA